MMWRGGRAVECTGLENRRWSNPTVGSNPTLSANRSLGSTKSRQRFWTPGGRPKGEGRRPETISPSPPQQRALIAHIPGAFLAMTALLHPLSLMYLETAPAPFWEIQSRGIAARVVRQHA